MGPGLMTPEGLEGDFSLRQGEGTDEPDSGGTENLLLQQENERLRQSNEELLAEVERLRHTAAIDKLTQLLNRDAFPSKLNEKFTPETETEAKRKPECGALAFIDLNGMKALNDRYGYEETNQILQQFGRRIRALVRGSDLVARWGGDEFLVYLSKADPNQVGQMLTYKLAKSLADEPIQIEALVNQFDPGKGKVNIPVTGVTFAVGVAPVPKDLARNVASEEQFDENVADLLTVAGNVEKAAKDYTGHNETVLAYQGGDGKQHILDLNDITTMIEGSREQ
jgi:diguanylate cyclase (GGDEF)-like protein